jgi:hypothetical protein
MEEGAKEIKANNNVTNKTNNANQKKKKEQEMIGNTEESTRNFTTQE